MKADLRTQILNGEVDPSRKEIACGFCQSVSYVVVNEIWLAWGRKRFRCWGCRALLEVGWHHTSGYAIELVQTPEE